LPARFGGLRQQRRHRAASSGLLWVLLRVFRNPRRLASPGDLCRNTMYPRHQRKARREDADVTSLIQAVIKSAVKCRAAVARKNGCTRREQVREDDVTLRYGCREQLRAESVAQRAKAELVLRGR